MILTNTKRQLLAQGFKDLANIVAGALIFGQFISQLKFNLSIMFLGFSLSLLFYVLAVIWQP